MTLKLHIDKYNFRKVIVQFPTCEGDIEITDARMHTLYSLICICIYVHYLDMLVPQFANQIVKCHRPRAGITIIGSISFQRNALRKHDTPTIAMGVQIVSPNISPTTTPSAFFCKASAFVAT
uniref:Uncharacterized protein n=1 Tax=Nelumbo nucifera TaxID=4432 RepID=A0A822ZRP3_NELNU|nr:TPA_asm: hypothetical protein HUJ06_018541 [Nelumbo nucifera]